MVDVKVELQELKEESDSQASAPAGAATAKRRSRRRWMAWAAAGVLILAAAAAVTLWRLRRPELPAADRGAAHVGATGRQRQLLARRARRSRSRSAGEDGDNWDIWLKIVGEAEARRLTTDPAVDGLPRLVSGRDADRIPAVRPPGLAAPRQRSTSCRRWAARHAGCPTFPSRGQLSWSPDGRWLAASKARSKGETTPESGGIHLISGRERRAARGDLPEATGRRPSTRPSRRTAARSPTPPARARSDTCRSATSTSCPSIPSSAPGSGSTPDPAAAVERWRGLDA